MGQKKHPNNSPILISSFTEELNVYHQNNAPKITKQDLLGKTYRHISSRVYICLELSIS